MTGTNRPFENRAEYPDVQVPLVDDLHHFSPSLTPLLSSVELVAKITVRHEDRTDSASHLLVRTSGQRDRLGECAAIYRFSMHHSR